MTTYILFLSTQTFHFKDEELFFSFWDKSPSHNHMSKKYSIRKTAGGEFVKNHPRCLPIQPKSPSRMKAVEITPND